jgi:hypothetical protein
MYKKNFHLFFKLILPPPSPRKMSGDAHDGIIMYERLFTNFTV